MILYEINTRAFSSTGDFAGIRAKLRHLAQLGVDTLWLMPIHATGVLNRKGPLGSPYAARDYFAIDPALGSAEELKALITDVHARGMRIILDIAANHTACDAVLLAEHPDFYRRDAATGQPISSEDDWTDVYALDYTNPELRAYMRRVFVYWQREIGFDGFRCDIAHYVPADFWQEVRADLGPHAILLAESEAGTPETAQAFNLGYGWRFFHALNAVFAEGASPTRLRDAFVPGSLLFTDNHDERRAITRLGERATLAASAIAFLLDGAPLLYNGQEIGDATDTALFDRLPIYWPAADRRPHFLKFYRDLIHLRRTHSAFQRGAMIWTSNTAADRVVSFFREGDNQEFLVAVNCSNQSFDGHVDGSTHPVSLGPYGVLVRERKWGVLLEL